MADYRHLMKMDRLANKDLADNPALRVPICICIDSSFSMNFSSKISIANREIRSFIENAKNDPYVCDTVDLSIVTFEGQYAAVKQPFANVKSVQFTDIVADGGSPLAAALKLSVGQIQSRKESYENAGITCYKPWLIIMSDGGCDDDIDEIAPTIRDLQEAGEMKVQCINLNARQEGMQILKKLIITGEVESYDAMKISNFFYYLSRNASTLSRSNPNDFEWLEKNDLNF